MVLTRITRMVSTTVGCWYFPESEATTTSNRTEQHKRPTLFQIYLHWCVHPCWKHWEQPNMTVALVHLVCHQPSSPSYLVVWFVLFVINQFHHHIWLFSVFPTGMNTSVQVYLKQCWPLMLSSSVGSSGSLWFWKVPTTNGCWYHPCYSSQYHVTYKLL